MLLLISISSLFDHIYSINQKAKKRKKKKTEFGKEKFLVSFQMCVQLLNNSSFFFLQFTSLFSGLSPSSSPKAFPFRFSLSRVRFFFHLLLLLLCAWCHDHFNSFFFCTRRELLNRIFSCYRIAVERLKNMNKEKNLTFSFFDDFCFCIHIKREEIIIKKNTTKTENLKEYDLKKIFNRFREVFVMTIFKTNRQGYFD